MHARRRRNAACLGQGKREFGDALRAALGVVVAEFQRAGPALQCSVVGLGQRVIGFFFLHAEPFHEHDAHGALGVGPQRRVTRYEGQRLSSPPSRRCVHEDGRTPPEHVLPLVKVVEEQKDQPDEGVGRKVHGRPKLWP